MRLSPRLKKLEGGGPPKSVPSVIYIAGAQGGHGKPVASEIASAVTIDAGNFSRSEDESLEDFMERVEAAQAAAAPDRDRTE